MDTNTKATLAAGMAAGYVVGRTKKGKLALSLASLVAGRSLDPASLIGQGVRKLAQSPQFGELGAQVRTELLGTGRSAVTGVANRGAASLTEALRKRTQALLDSEDEEGEEDEDAEDAEGADDEEGAVEDDESGDGTDEGDLEDEAPEDAEDAEDEEPPEEERPARRRASGRKDSGDDKQPAARGTARRAGAKGAAAKKAAEKPAKKAAAKPAKKAAKKARTGGSAAEKPAQAARSRSGRR
jgi:hypothetical protein